MQFTAWATDSNGNYVSSPVGLAMATDASLQAIETTFHQDLNGDGVIGVNIPTTVIEALGAFCLVQSGANYFYTLSLHDALPILKNAGAVVFAGEYAPWTPIGT